MPEQVDLADFGIKEMTSIPCRPTNIRYKRANRGCAHRTKKDANFGGEKFTNKENNAKKAKSINKINCIFSPKDLYISNFCCNFAVKLKSY